MADASDTSSRSDAPNAAPATPTTPARVDANRANATLSTGPRTAAGLARSSSNALAHGLSARAVVVRGESAEQWEAFRDAVIVDLAPVGPIEGTLAMRAAELLWRLQRAGAAEAAVANFALARAEQESIRVALDAHQGPGDGSPFCLRSCDTVAALRAAGIRAKAAGEAGNQAIDGDDADPLDAPAVKDLLRVAAVLVGDGDVDFIDPTHAKRRRPRPSEKVTVLAAWTVGAVRATVGDFAGGYGGQGRAHAPGLLLRRACRVSLETTLRALYAAADAEQRTALAQGTTAAGDDSAAVRRHEAHLQRQLAGALALLESARARRTARQ